MGEPGGLLPLSPLLEASGGLREFRPLIVAVLAMGVVRILLRTVWILRCSEPGFLPWKERRRIRSVMGTFATRIILPPTCSWSFP